MSLNAIDGSCVRSVWHQLFGTVVGILVSVPTLVYAIVCIVNGYDVSASMEFPGINDLVYRLFWVSGVVAFLVVWFRARKLRGRYDIMVVFRGSLLVWRFPRVLRFRGSQVESIAFDEDGYSVSIRAEGGAVFRGSPMLFHIDGDDHRAHVDE